MPEVRGPTLRRRELAAILRALRTERGLTVEQVAERLLCSPSKVSRMETSQRGATVRDVRDLCALYGVTDRVQVDRLMDLARGGKEQGWWQPCDLDYFGTYVGLEQEATSISCYQSAAVPGLLQTPAYVRAMHEIALPKVGSERIDQLIDVRVRRQQLLAKDPPLKLWAILDEAVLHRNVGGPHVMKEQMEQLLEMAAWRHVTIQVIPFSAGAHPAMESSFNILNFDVPALSMVYVEGLLGFIYVDRPQDIGKYGLIFEHLGAQALSPQESIDLVKEIREIYAPGENLGLGRAPHEEAMIGFQILIPGQSLAGNS